jgi:predicted glycogen debranching enzyme
VFGRKEQSTMIGFGRIVCGNPYDSRHLEWLVTNGIGGFASGTVSGELSRRYHGLLIAALNPPVGRTLLLAKLDETIHYQHHSYPLFCNRQISYQLEPEGFQFIESFRLENLVPVWTFALPDVLLEKRVWLEQGENTTYIQYRFIRPPYSEDNAQSIHLALAALVNYRDYHTLTRKGNGLEFHIEPVAHGIGITPVFPNSAKPFYLLSSQAKATLRQDWSTGFYLEIEESRGENSVEDHFIAGEFRTTLRPGESCTLVASTRPHPELDGEKAYQVQRDHQNDILAKWQSLKDPHHDQEAHTTLILAASQFIVQRASPKEPEGYSIIAGYPWFSDWGRDTMISLPGLTLATGRTEIARKILRTFTAYLDQGMLPNRFPDQGETPEYNTVDATLWYFEAIRAYYAATGDDALVSELFPTLQEIISWHLRGTRYRIHCDPQDGLIYAGERGVQLTWMDAKVDDWVVTPRIGKTVEINSLWYNALCIMARFAPLVGASDEIYTAAAKKALLGFDRFWNSKRGYCFDVIDGPEGDDPALRPNQIFAVSLPYSPLSMERQRRVVAACGRDLLTSYGLRSLGPDEPGYKGHYNGNRYERDGAYHQGTVWGWLIGPFVSAHLRVYQDPAQARSFLEPFFYHLTEAGLGSVSEIFDGNPPFSPNGCFAQAWSVGEVLRALDEIAHFTD